MDSLSAFTVLWAHIATLQCVKCYYTLNGGLDVVLFVSLAGGIIYAMLMPHRSSSLLTLCTTHIASLAIHPSRSNHVLVATVLAVAVLLSACSDRTVWQERMSGSIYMITVVLYLVAWLHKMNYDFFDYRYSCSSLYFSGFFSIWMDVPTATGASGILEQLVRLVIQTAPFQAIVMELVLPMLLILWKFGPETWSEVLFKVFIVMGSAFHVIICLPLPPLSVYPFSMVMAPIYVMLLPLDSVTKTLQHLSTYWTALVAYVCFLTMGVLYAVNHALHDEPMPLEYPPYGLWTPSVVWSLTVWPLIVYTAVGATPRVRISITFHTGSTKTYSEAGRRDSIPSPGSSGYDGIWKLTTTGAVKTSMNPSFSWSRSGLVLAFIVGLIGIAPYLGVRDYPALAMFSNLRVHGGKNNHLFVRGMALTPYLQETVTVHESNLHTLRHYQVNLALYFSGHTKQFNEAFGVVNEFWISPPFWRVRDDRKVPFVPYSIPLVELRKRIVAARLQTDFYVKFTMHNETKPRVFDTREPQNDWTLFRTLTKPVSWFESGIVNFRSFDDTYSPCRH